MEGDPRMERNIRVRRSLSLNRNYIADVLEGKDINTAASRVKIREMGGFFYNLFVAGSINVKVSNQEFELLSNLGIRPPTFLRIPTEFMAFLETIEDSGTLLELLRQEDLLFTKLFAYGLWQDMVAVFRNTIASPGKVKFEIDPSLDSVEIETAFTLSQVIGAEVKPDFSKNSKANKFVFDRSEDVLPTLMILEGKIKFDIFPFQAAIAQMINDFIQTQNLEIVLNPNDFHLLRQGSLFDFPDSLPEKFLNFLDTSENQYYKAIATILRNNRNLSIVVKFAKTFMKIVLGEHDYYMILGLKDKVKVISSRNILDNRGVQESNTEPELVNQSKPKLRRLIEDEDLEIIRKSEMLDKALQENETWVGAFIQNVADIFNRGYELHISQNLMSNLQNGRLPDPDYLMPSGLEHQFQYSGRNPMKDLVVRNAFMYVFWHFVLATRDKSYLKVYSEEDADLPEIKKHKKVPVKMPDKNLGPSMQSIRNLNRVARKEF